MKKVVLLFHILILFCTCSESSKSDIEFEKKQIIDLYENWMNFKSPDEYVNFITDDFISIANGHNPVGRDSIYKVLIDSYQTIYFSVPVWNSEEIIICNELAIHRYNGVLNFHYKEDDRVYRTENYNYMDVVKKTSNGWKVMRHMRNEDEK